MRWYLLAIMASWVITGNCRCQEKGSGNNVAHTTNSLSSIEALLVGTWRWDVPAQEETNAFMKIHLSFDRSWSWSIHSDNPRTESDEQSGSWFVHERTLVLRIAKTKSKFFKKVAWPFDIKTADSKTLVLTNSPLGDVTWTRIAQQVEAPNERR
jgi:hypothetical protein